MIIQSINFLDEPEVDSTPFATARLLPPIQYLYYYISFAYVDSALGSLQCADTGCVAKHFRGMCCLHLQGAHRSTQSEGPREESTSATNHHESLKSVITFLS
jgi:hypothetical protein